LQANNWVIPKKRTESQSTPMPDILIIDDDPLVNDLLSSTVESIGCTTHSVFTAAEALTVARSGCYDVVLLDVGLPDGDGLELLPEIRAIPNPPEVIIITGLCDPDSAELAIRSGAWDYIVKPPSVDNIILVVQRALAYHAEKSGRSAPKVLKRDRIVGNSPALNAVLERIAQAAVTESNVLVTGETGTGKELLSQAIHDNSARTGHRFVVVDCAALPDTLVESVLFGHTKGAFTGAEKERDGLIRQAHGGTLLLDEVGELPLSIQKAFLRVIQERRFRPVSGHQEIQVDFRLIAATNRDLDTMAAEGRFRDDLLFRLRSFSVDVPPLRDRQDDIKALTVHYINRLCDIYTIENKGFSSDFIEALQQYKWPGNIRELFHTLEETFAVAGAEPILHPHHLPIRIRAILTRMTVGARTQSRPEEKQLDLRSLNKETFLKIAEFRSQMERHYLQQLTLVSNGNRKEACRISGLSRTRLFELLKKHQLDKPVSIGRASTISP
jgi:two-component system NtrC family response regulator